MIVFAEFLAIGAVIMCMLFIVVDMGQPQRVLNIILHPTPNSVMFWDATVLCGYLLLNAVIGWTSLEHESRHVAVEEIRAAAGIDIGGTLIGMHLKRVAVPVRLTLDHIGQAHILCARTRPKLIGGERAKYTEED